MYKVGTTLIFAGILLIETPTFLVEEYCTEYNGHKVKIVRGPLTGWAGCRWADVTSRISQSNLATNTKTYCNSKPRNEKRGVSKNVKPSAIVLSY